jgi:hypothetical protein
MMSLDELNELLPAVDTTDTDDVLLPTHTWLSYHTSIQGYNVVSNTPGKPLPSLGHTAKQAKHDYEVLQG